MSHPDIFDLGAEDRPWWVAHTRSRQEKALARYLVPLDIPFYVPQSEKHNRRGVRDRVSYLPLFPGYVFFRGSIAERLSALQSGLLVGVLEVTEQGLLNGELRELRRLQESGASLVPHHEFHPGDPVRIMEGPFAGYSGVIIRGQASLRLVVSITMLRKTVAVEFDRAVVKAARATTRIQGETRSAVA